MARASRSTTRKDETDGAAEAPALGQDISTSDALITVVDGFRKELSLLRGAIGELTQAILGGGKGALPGIAAAPAPTPLDDVDDEDRKNGPVTSRGTATKKAAAAAAAGADDEAPPARSSGRKKAAAAAPAPTEIICPGSAARLQLITQLGSPPSRKQEAAQDPLDQFDVAIPGTEYFLLGDIVVGEDDRGELLLQLRLGIGQEIVKKGETLLQSIAEIGVYDTWEAPVAFEYENASYLAVAPLDDE